jgi:hypothetical protein
MSIITKLQKKSQEKSLYPLIFLEKEKFLMFQMRLNVALVAKN